MISLKTEAKGPGLFIVSTAAEPGVFTVRVVGEIDKSNEDLFREHMDYVLSKTPDRIIFALSEVGFMGSAGLRCLEMAAKSCPSVCLKDPSRSVRGVMRVSGLKRLLPVCED